MRSAMLGVLAVVAFAACAKFEKKRECTELAQTVNRFIGASKGGKPPNYADPALAARESRQLAVRYRKLSSELTTLALRSEELVPHVEAYRKLAEQAGTALEGAAVALEKHDLELARTRRNDFDKASRAERPLVQVINEICAH